MNAASEIHHVQRQDYYPMVKAFMPHAEGDELDCRASLLLMRDRAMSTQRVASEYGWLVLSFVQRIASENALRSMPLDDLREIRRLAIRLVTCAAGFDAMFAPQLPFDEKAG